MFGVRKKIADGSEVLGTKYFCKVERKKTVDGVLRISTPTTPHQNNVSFRYVLVIDVSGSMDQKLGGSNETLLDRIKKFATACVGKLNDSSWLSIITFSEEATTEMEMTRMDNKGKNNAQRIIASLQSQSATNLSAGLLKGLETTRGGDPGIRDCIILFTDGVANRGITDVDLLVEAYNNLSRGLGKMSRVPVSAFTIGNYEPHFLHEISKRMGAEAFYWLNESYNTFEDDLFTPLCLRESTQITDISIKLTGLQGVKFDASATSTDFLEASSERELTYFFHIIPPTMKKHISFRLILPSESLDGERILTITKTCLNFEGRLLSWTEHLELRVKSMFDILPSIRRGLNEQASEIQMNIAAYSMQNNRIYDSLQSAENAFTKVLQEECRLATAKALKKACQILRNSNTETSKAATADQCFQQTSNKIKHLQNQARAALGPTSRFFEQFCDKAALMESIIAVDNLTKDFNWGRLASMESSVSAEMPTATEVFDKGRPQPFMTRKVEIKLQIFREAVPVDYTEAMDEEESDSSFDDESDSAQRVEVHMEDWIAKLGEFFLTCIFLFFILLRTLIKRYV